MRIVLACPTIPERRERRKGLEILWRDRTPEADLEIIYSEAGTTWAAGLNDVWAQVRDNPPDVLVLGSDDMIPGDERWLPTARHWLALGKVPAPTVEDPRFTSYGGHPQPVPDGTPSDMTAFIIIDGRWGHDVFPLPDDLHYYSDNAACMLLTRAGHEIVTVPTCRIIHVHAQEGRGAGFGSENNRLHVDTVRYSRWLESIGVDRMSLPASQRGGMWEERYQAVGREMGA